MWYTFGSEFVAGLLAMAPDFDIVFMGVIPYGHFFGHRGIFHAPALLSVVALCLSSALWLIVCRLTPRQWLVLSAVFALALVSHPLLDALTDGGEGVMLLYPLSQERVFFPWRPIRVAPLSPGRLSPRRAAAIVATELPFAIAFLALGAGLNLALRRRDRRPSHPTRG